MSHIWNEYLGYWEENAKDEDIGEADRKVVVLNGKLQSDLKGGP